ncbi:MAG: hypothetical protein LBM70_09465 [Victivallales bacterium]|jgi:Na+/proline symporter|nr:hypothetical protein [Victivallales bacterium]
MHWVDWCILLIPLLTILGLSIYSGKYVRSVVDFLAAGRVAGRYTLAVGDMAAGLGVITLVALCESKFQSGYGIDFWSKLGGPVSIVLSLTGFCVYRWRETKALSFGQFLEIRYSRSFRVFAASIRVIAETITNAIGPAIAVNFFLYFLNIPHAITIWGLNIPCYAIVLTVLIAVAMVCIWSGGRVSLLITDTFQGILCYPVFVVLVGYILVNFSWSTDVVPVMMDRVPGESFINPYDLDKLRDFNIFALIVTIFSTILNRASWFGNDTSNSARTPHEQKMAGVLGAWRSGLSVVLLTVVALMVITIMNNGKFADEAKEIRDTLTEKVAIEAIPNPVEREKIVAEVKALPPQRHIPDGKNPLSITENLETPIFETVKKTIGDDGEGNFTFQRFRTMYQQMMMTIAMRKTLPVGIAGAFGLLMIMLMISTDDSRIFNSSSTILQDVIMPFMKKPFTPKGHLLALRLSALGVAVIFWFFSLLFVQLDYIFMFITIMCAIWLGGAGAVTLGGLYTKFGNTVGAYSAVIAGATVSVGGIFMQRYWAQMIYPMLCERGWDKAVGNFLSTVSDPFNPYIVWTMNPEKFPINSQEIYFIAMLCGISGYVIGSLVTYKEPFNLDRMLHRGVYSIDGEKKISSKWTLKNTFGKLIGITPEYSRGDKIIAWSVFFYSIVYTFVIMFIGVWIWNLFSPWPEVYWSYYFYVNTLLVPSIAGIITTVWFMWGGIRDTIRLFRDLENRTVNVLDDGRVSGHVSLADQAEIDHIDEEVEEAREADERDEKQ